MQIHEAPNVIIIPAYNEDSWLELTLKKVHESMAKTKINAHLIVVDDGSKDRTAEVARKAGCEVIQMPKNVGKANAVFAGFKRAVELGAHSTILLDADILKMEDSLFSEMISTARKNTVEKKEIMLVSPWREKREDFPTIHVSGIRSFSTPALHRVLSSKVKGVVKGYGLEVFLNHLFAGRKMISLDGRQTMHGARAEFVGREAFASVRSKET